MRAEKISADISLEGKNKLIELCNKFERSRGFMIERMINKFYEQTFGQQEAKPSVPAVKEPKAKRKAFAKPTYQEVHDYMIERGMDNFNARNESEKFVDFFISKDWKVGKNPMKDWKAAVRNWMKGKDFSGQSNGLSKVTQKNIQNLEDW